MVSRRSVFFADDFPIRQRGTSISYCSSAVLAAELPVAMLRLSTMQHFIPARHNSCVIKAPVMPEPTMTTSVDRSFPKDGNSPIGNF